MSAGAIAEFKIVEAAAQRFAKGAVKKRLPLGSWSEVIDYCRTSMAFEGREISASCFSTEERPDRRRGPRVGHRRPHAGLSARSHAPRAGVVGHRDRAGSQSPLGRPDALDPGLKMTLDIIAVAKTLGVAVHDHIIVGRDGHASLRGMRLI